MKTTYTPAEVIALIDRDPAKGPNCAKLTAYLQSDEVKDVRSMSLGTWAPGHPKDIEEFADGMLAMMEGAKNACAECGESWLKIDSLGCQKSWLLQLLGRIKVHSSDKRLAPLIDEWVADAFKRGDGEEARLVDIGARVGKPLPDAP